MKPAALDLTIYQGSTYKKAFQWKTGKPPQPVDLTGCTARMQIRKKVTDSVVLFELTTQNNRIVITDPTEGKFEIRLTAVEAASLTFKTGVYDFEIVYPGGEPVYRLFEGTIEVMPEVTR
jgi:hypothetical protein